MADRYNLFKYSDRARVKIRALFIVVIFAILALVAIYYIVIRDSGVGPPPPESLSLEDKVEILEEISRTNQSTLTLEERQEILNQLVESSPKINQ